MGNALGEDIEGKIVILSTEFLAPVPFGVKDKKALEELPELRVFEVTGGFGSHPHTRGNAIMGTFLIDGEHARMEGYMVERYATDEEIAKARQRKTDADQLRASLVGEIEG